MTRPTVLGTAVKIDQYGAHMAAQLAANAFKGDWLAVDDDQGALDLIYHVAKLIIAHRKGNDQAVLEYAADVGNEAMFIADRRRLLGQGVPPTQFIGNVLDGREQYHRDDVEDSGDGDLKRDVLSIAAAFLGAVDGFVAEAVTA